MGREDDNTQTGERGDGRNQNSPTVSEKLLKIIQFATNHYKS